MDMYVKTPIFILGMEDALERIKFKPIVNHNFSHKKLKGKN